jgi:hypothetical protein
MSETTYQFGDPTGKLPDDYFKNPEHFEETGADLNLVAHARTAEFSRPRRRHGIPRWRGGNLTLLKPLEKKIKPLEK